MDTEQLATFIYEVYGDVNANNKERWLAVATRVTDLFNHKADVVDFSEAVGYIRYLAKYFNKDLNEINTVLEETNKAGTNIIVFAVTEKTSKTLAVITNIEEASNYGLYNYLYTDSTLPKLLNYYNKQLTNEELINLYNDFFCDP